MKGWGFCRKQNVSKPRVQAARVVQRPSMEQCSWLGFHLMLPLGTSPLFLDLVFERVFSEADFVPLKDLSGDILLLLLSLQLSSACVCV